MRLGVLISGRGSNLQALIDAASDPTYPAEVALVISNKPDAAGLDRARAVGIATLVLKPKDFADKAAHEAAMIAALENAGVGLVCLAGYMRLLSPVFVQAWHNRLINIHPSLLPAFPGLDTHAKAIESGVRFHGCTVHFVRVEMDTGPIIVQAAVPVSDDDTPDTLADRVLIQEHRAYPLAVRLIAEQRVTVGGNRVSVRGGTMPNTVIAPIP
ncbi:MAG: phosphoribosylglycinamide formyltransferase [Niveispirillum sp.]|nr:phosphoribosylglycinamide formyltransferase [Niveispirillum sp.]